MSEQNPFGDSPVERLRKLLRDRDEKRRQKRRFRQPIGFIGFMYIAVVVLTLLTAVFLGVRGCQLKDRCERMGGHYDDRRMKCWEGKEIDVGW